jgi:two-component system CheB/CheR fusion protein
MPVIDGIALQLGQVFQNLISNSLKFSRPDVNPVIRINARVENRNNDAYCIISYSDNGIGFKQVYADKIFEIFQRLHTREKYEGTGVGLAIVKKIISLHNGEITAFGEEDSGARFEILLPVKQD